MPLLAPNALSRAFLVTAAMWCRQRLYEEEVKDDGVSNKMMWPKTDDCEACFNSTEGGSDGGATLHAIFEYHQEVYCFESDTYVCSGFDDPSKQTSSRPVPTPTPQKGVQKA